MTPKEDEQAVAERLKIDWPAPAFQVRHDVRVPGKKSRKPRQVDIAIFEAGSSVPFLLVEAKRHRRSVDVGIAGSTIALVQDVDGIPTVMVSTSGFSVAASNHLSAEGIGHVTITLPEAQGLRWIPVLEKRFALNQTFKAVSGTLVEALRRGNAEPFHDEALAYEEWLAVIYTGLSLFPETTINILHVIAADHYDDGHRFNAIQILLEEGALSQRMLRSLRAAETDPDVVELLEQCLGDLDCTHTDSNP